MGYRAPNGSYGDDCLIGQSYAFEYLQYRIRTGSGSLPLIAKCMPRKITGIEVGFLSVIDGYALKGAILSVSG